MMRQIFVFICLLLLCSCGKAPMKSELPTDVQPGKSELYGIKILRWGELQFSGLMGVQYNSTGFKYALLDASGVKLIEANVNQAEELVLHYAVPMMKETKLPDYLGLWTKRMLLEQPESRPCSWRFTNSFCVDEKPLVVQKSSRVGTFLIWQTTKSIQGEGKGVDYVYSHPLIGVELKMNLINRK